MNMFWQVRNSTREFSNKPLDAERLWKYVVEQGEFVDAPPVFPALIHATVCREGEVIVMRGVSGVHTLRIAVSDAARLHAHWQGFKLGAEAAACKQGWRKTP